MLFIYVRTKPSCFHQDSTLDLQTFFHMKLIALASRSIVYVVDTILMNPSPSNFHQNLCNSKYHTLEPSLD